MKRLCLLFLVPVLLAGCQQNSTVVANQPGGSSGNSSSTGTSDQPGTPATGTNNYDPSAPSTQQTAPAQPTLPGIAIPGRGKVTGEFDAPLDSHDPKVRAPLPPDLAQQLDKVKEELSKRFDIPETNTGDWVHIKDGEDSKTAMQIADAMEQTLAKMTDTYGHVQAAYESPDGNGTFDQDLRVKNSSEFQVPFITVGNNPLTCQEVANGTVKLVQYGPEWRDKQPVNAPTKSYTPNAAPQFNWERDFTQMIYEPITHSKFSWPEIVKQWVSGDEGYKIEVDFRKKPFQLEDPKTHQIGNYAYKDYRFKVTRSDAAATMYGKSEIEVVVDAYKWLPVTIRSVYTDQTGTKTWKITWTCSYKFKQLFTDKDFKAPFSAKIKA